MNTLQVANGTLHYAVYGTGPPVLMLHGGGLDGRMWDLQVPELAQTHRVVVPDARGHGHSSTPCAPFRHCDDVAVLIRHLDAGPAILIGLSMGAGTALDTALEHPDLVRAVVVVGAGTSEPDFEDPWVLDLLDTWRRTAAAGDAEGWIEAFLLFAAGPERRLEDMDDDVVRHLRQMVTRTVATHVRPDAAAPGTVPNSWSRLAEIQVPALALSGALDTPDNIRMAARAADSVADGRTALIGGAAHYPNLERPEAFNAELQAFLASMP